MLNELNTYTLEELYKQPIDPIPWVVEDLLAPGLYFLGGSPKVGKSWLALQLCLAVCRGEPFLGFKTKRNEVLYISLEDGPRRLHIRALRMTEKAPAGLHLCGHAPMIGQGLEQQLDQMLAEHPGIKLVIIDTLQKIREATGASPSYSIDYRDASALKAVADRNDICLLVVHHLRKQEDKDPFKQLSGTNGLNGAADGTIVLDRQKRQEGTATLSATGRDIEDMELTLDFSDCRWSRGCSPDELQLMYLLPAIRQLLASGEFLGSATERGQLPVFLFFGNLQPGQRIVDAHLHKLIAGTACPGRYVLQLRQHGVGQPHRYHRGFTHSRLAMRNYKLVLLRHVAPPPIFSCSYYGAQWCIIYILQICNTKRIVRRTRHEQATFYLLLHRASQSADWARRGNMETGVRLPRATIGGGRALLWRGRRAGF